MINLIIMAVGDSNMTWPEAVAISALFISIAFVLR